MQKKVGRGMLDSIASHAMSINTNDPGAFEELRGCFMDLLTFIRLDKFPPINYYAPIRFKQDVELSEVCSGRFEDKGDHYEIYVTGIAPTDEFITVNKETREIVQEGFFGLVADWECEGLIENF